MTSPRTSQRNRHACARTIVTLQQQDGGYALLWKHYDNNKMAATCYYGNVQQQYGSYALLWKRYDNNNVICNKLSLRVYCCCCRCILHLQQYSRRLHLFLFYVFCDTFLSYLEKDSRDSPSFPVAHTTAE